MTWACQKASPIIKTKLTHPRHTATDYYYDQLMTWACQMASPTIKTKLTHPRHTTTDYYYDSPDNGSTTGEQRRILAKQPEPSQRAPSQGRERRSKPDPLNGSIKEK